MVYSTQSYLSGVWPPCQRSYWQTWKVYHNLAVAHKLAYNIIHYSKKKKSCKDKVGVAHNSISVHTYRKNSIFDYIFMRFVNFFWNDSFYYLTRGKHDFLGINYYFHYRVDHFSLNPLHFFVDVHSEHREMTSVGWEIYPQGIFNVLLNMRKYNLPIYITENGIATLSESKRQRYLVSYLKEVYHAILAGVNVRGYFYWSLLDNFEWEKGFQPRFGLIGVDYKNFKRQVRSTAKIYAEICHTNSIPPRLLKLVGHSIELKPKS